MHDDEKRCNKKRKIGGVRVRVGVGVKIEEDQSESSED